MRLLRAHAFSGSMSFCLSPTSFLARAVNMGQSVSQVCVHVYTPTVCITGSG